MSILDVGRSLTPMWLRYRVMELRGRGLFFGYPDQHRCVFIHIPKTGGTSVARSLFGVESRHVPYQEYERANSRKFRTYFKFAFVRNPRTRLVSAYDFLKRGGMNPSDARWAEEHLGRFSSFEQFVHEWVRPENVTTWPHFVPQHAFLFDDTGRIHVDFLGRFERLAADYRVVADRLGVNRPLLEENRSPVRARQDRYTPEMTAIVERTYARDIELLGYPSEGST